MGKTMDSQVLQENLTVVRSKRQLLVDLLGRNDLSESLADDIRQALAEIDDLVVEFDRTFPSS